MQLDSSRNDVQCSIQAMRLRATGENLLESIAVRLNVAPVTLVDTHMAFIRARAIMVATKLGVFDALAAGPLDAHAVAAACGTSPSATRHLLNALAGAGYLGFEGTTFAIGAVARKWLLSNSATSLRDKVLFEFVEWNSSSSMEAFVNTGRAEDLHGDLGDDGWESVSARDARAVGSGGARKSSGARRCRGARPRCSTSAARTASFRWRCAGGIPICAPSFSICRRRCDRRRRSSRRSRWATAWCIARAMHWLDDLGERQWDFVYVSQLLHHFDEPTNRTLVKRIAAALKPGGVLAVLEMIRPPRRRRPGQVGALLDLYFALTSQSGTWSVEEIAGWQREAGLAAIRPMTLRTDRARRWWQRRSRADDYCGRKPSSVRTRGRCSVRVTLSTPRWRRAFRPANLTRGIP